MNFQNAKFAAAFGLAEQLPPSDRPEIAFAGRSNVGKSSALNKLMQRKSLARVSRVPGKTATINFYEVDGIRLVDLPGYGYAKTSKAEQERWSELMEAYFAQERDLRLVVSLMDLRHPPTALDLQMVDFLVDRGLPFMILLTKCDKLNKTELANRLASVRGELSCGDSLILLPFSGETGEGTEELRKLIEEACTAE